MTQPDKLVRKSYAWFREGVDRALNESGVPAAQRDQAAALLFKLVGLNAGGALPANPQLEDFGSTGAVAESIAYAGLVVSESIVAIDTVSRVVQLQQSDPGGELGDALQLVGDAVKQVQRVIDALPPQTLPSAFGLAKILLTLSGDANVLPAASEPHAKRLAEAIAGAGSATRTQDVSAALALLAIVVGAILDRAFKAPSAGDVGWIANAVLPSPPPSDFPQLLMPLAAALPGPGVPSIALDIEKDAGNNPIGVRLGLAKQIDSGIPIGDSGFHVGFHFAGAIEARIPFADGKPQLTTDPPEFGISVSRKKADGALVIGPVTSPFGSASLKVGEFGAGFTLSNGDPRLDFFAREGKAELAIEDSFLAEVLSGDIVVDFDLEAQADRHGTLRLKNGSGIRVTLPVPKIPSGPFELQLITFAIEPLSGLDHLQCELSASFAVDAGPFAASVDRLGITIDLQHLLAGTPEISVGFKPPSGLGLTLDVGVVKGGGYLYIDPERGEYAGTLELELMAIGVKAIAILTTKSPAGWSLLLMIYGQFPPIQLSWGFTLTGIGGLIGVQHTLDADALSQGMSTGALDAILFPADPVADAPQIINTLRTLFPVQRGGFVIGPMLEVGWGSPNLVTVQLGLLIEESQIALIGQAVVQIPPLVDEDLALLRLQVDFLGVVQYDPFAIRIDAMLRDSRVLFITLTGQFAFRLQTGDHPTFLISAGGFHPRFNDVPSDVPVPFQRIGAGFDIGIIGVDFKGYFAITSATVQGGSELRIWADLGIAGIEGGFGFDAICYLEPKFYFELDLRAYVTVTVFGGDFAGVRVEGLLAGPGRWRIAGRGYLELPLVPDIEIDIDESWGEDRATPQVSKNVADLLRQEIGKRENWSAQLPADGESLVSLATIEGVTDVLAHPSSVLAFRQKLAPWERDLTRVGIARIDGANRFGFQDLKYGTTSAGTGAMQVLRDYFAAAQFFEIKEDERLQGPSFSEYDAGIEFRGEDFVFEETLSETLDYEEANLSDNTMIKMVVAFHLAELGGRNWVAELGAAARSSLRDKAKLLPAEMPKIGVKPAAVAVTERHTQAAATDAVFSDYWQARDSIATNAQLDRARHQVAELYELD